MSIEKHYSNGDVTIVWKPDLCQHSARCFRTLPEVFNPRVNPWIKPDGTESQVLISVVSSCPSGALTIQASNSAQGLPDPQVRA
ncbi:MAG: (4Fe-4S)-binding protein [bacterium]|nr:(4Fe-4S)-binding protein [bacterium]